MAVEHVPNGTPIQITAAAHRGAADKLQLDVRGLDEALKYARRVNRYRDGLRLWRLDDGAGTRRAGWACVHEAPALDGSARLVSAVVVDILTDAEVDNGPQVWLPRLDVPQQRRRAPSGPRARAR